MQTGEAIVRPPLRSAGVRTPSVIAAAATALFVVVMTLSGAAFLIGPPSVVSSIRHLGYPDYFRSLLGLAKLLGVAAIALPRLAALREWAYAGFTFVLGGAVVSHLASGEPTKIAPALFVLGLLSTSYLLRRRHARAERRTP